MKTSVSCFMVHGLHVSCNGSVGAEGRLGPAPALLPIILTLEVGSDCDRLLTRSSADQGRSPGRRPLQVQVWSPSH